MLLAGMGTIQQGHTGDRVQRRVMSGTGGGTFRGRAVIDSRFAGLKRR